MMTSDTLKSRAFPAPWCDTVEFLVEKNVDGKRMAATLTEFVEVKPTFAATPTFSLDFKEAQVLMDDLWASGLRPTEGSGSAGSLAATERHLKDMQRLVFEHSVRKQR
jgi:hypothetical protein